MRRTLKSISAVIPNYNGRDLLERFLPGIVKATQVYSSDCQTILVDDGSSDGSVDFVERHFPSIEVVRHERNMGALSSFNTGLRRCRNEVVLRVNNDYSVDPHFVEPLVAHMEDPEVFGACAEVLVAGEGRRNESLAFGRFKWGSFHVVQPGLSSAVSITSACPVLFPYGGVCVYDRGKLQELGGYDMLYAPLYWEDVDLGYRAWKRGWRCIYEPSSKALHEHMSTMRRKHTPVQLTRLVRRNILLFTWRNLTDGDLLASHLALLSARLAWHLAKVDPLFVQILRSAMERLPEVRARRAGDRPALKLGDRQVLSLWSGLVG